MKDLLNKKIVLASQSPRRHSLIKKLDVDFDVVSPSFDEKLDSDNYTDDAIKSLSLKKALSVLENSQDTDICACNKYKDCLIISADTMVVLNNKIYGKPKSEQRAKQMLKELSGQRHFVVTAVTVLDADTKQSITEVVKTYVTFQDLSDELIDSYVTTNKPLDKAGAYGIQEMGSDFIKEVDGDLENVIGLANKNSSQNIGRVFVSFFNVFTNYKSLPQQFLYFLPLPHGQGSFLPILSPFCTGA